MEDLERMTDAVRHRGPDGEGYWHENEVFLGHRRLSIIDLADGAQPMHSHDGRFVTVFNGEIYNHIELREDLLARGAVFQTDHSDTEVLLEAYRHWGTDFHTHLNGMWAAAIYDRHKGVLLLTRDRFGKKPLYYAKQGGCFAFASELRALCLHSQVRPRISSAAVRKFLGHGYIPGSATIYGGVSKLPGGTWLLLKTDSHQVRSQRYWRFELSPLRPSEADEPRAAAVRLLEHLRSATAVRLRADVPVGVFLSGGIDSSTVAALAAREVSKLSSFSIGFEERDFDETPHAMTVARELGLEHEHTHLSAGKCRELAPEVLCQLDEPLGDPSLIPTFLLCKMASRRVKVCLSGDGADELFAGYDPFRAIKPAALYGRIVPRSVHQLLRRSLGLLPVSFSNMSLDFKVNRTLRGLSYPAELWTALWMAPCDLPDIRRLTGAGELDEVFADALELHQKIRTLGRLEQMLLYFTNLYLRDDILTKVDRASMLNGLEVRSPFLDVELVNYVRTLPTKWKLNGSTTKWLLKEAIRGLVPEQIAQRKKKGFGMPIGQWFHEGSLSIDFEELDQFVDIDAARQMAAEHRRREANHSWALWCLFVLAAWGRAQREHT